MKAIYAGSIQNNDKNGNSLLEQRKALAGRQAKRVIANVYAGEKRLDAQKQKISDNFTDLLTENGTLGDQILENQKKMDALQKKSGVEQDSQEQKDLELLEKGYDLLFGQTNETFTQDELDQLRGLNQTGLTSYQSQTLFLYGRNRSLKSTISGNTKAMQALNSGLTEMKLERLKSDPMGQAQKAADEILAQSSKDIIGLLIGEAQDHLDDKQQEREEQQQKQEERAGQQSQQTQENQPGGTTQNASLSVQEIQDRVKSEMKKLLEKMKSLSDSLKGSGINYQI